jgi:hypothetical protein
MIGMDVLDHEGITLATVCNESSIEALQSYSKYFQGYTFLLVRIDLRLRKNHEGTIIRGALHQQN